MKNRHDLDFNILEVLQVPIIVTTREGVVKFVNSSFLAMTGYKREELLEKKYEQIIQEPEIDRYHQIVSDVLSGHLYLKMRQNLKVQQGSVAVTYLPSIMKVEQEEFVLGQVIDPLRHLAERENVKQNGKSHDQVEANAVKELNEFAYIVSHDLKAPLRALVNLANWIEEDLQEVANDDIRDNLKLLKGRVGRLESMINGILQYSRINKTANTFEPVNVMQVIHKSIELVSIQPTFEVRIPDNLPELSYSKADLEAIFVNLITNAVKHHHKEQGIIEIGYEERTNEHVFTVSDDGPGIAAEFHDRIFKIFQTLKPRDEMESTGIGLTIVKKIIEGRGGSISVESNEGTGTRFIFTIPK